MEGYWRGALREREKQKGHYYCRIAQYTRQVLASRTTLLQWRMTTEENGRRIMDMSDFFKSLRSWPFFLRRIPIINLTYSYYRYYCKRKKNEERTEGQAAHHLFRNKYDVHWEGGSNSQEEEIRSYLLGTWESRLLSFSWLPYYGFPSWRLEDE